MGIDALNPIEPYGMDIRQIKRRFGRNLTLVGNMDVGGMLSIGNDFEIQAAGQDAINAARAFGEARVGAWCSDEC